MEKFPGGGSPFEQLPKSQDGQAFEERLTQITASIEESIYSGGREKEDPSLEKMEGEVLSEKTLELIQILGNNQASSEITERAEKMLIKVFNSAGYSSPNELDAFPIVRRFSDKYAGSMEQIYKLLSKQTLVRSTIEKENTKAGKEESTAISAIHDGVHQKKSDIGKEEAVQANRLLSSILHGYGLNEKEITDTWKMSSFESLPHQDVTARDAFMNLERLRSLEQMRPGSALVLEKEFGIKFFGRYNEDLLVRQYDQRNNSDIPYGVLIQGYHDANGIFMVGDKEVGNFASRLEGKYDLRVLEVSGKKDLSDKSNSLDKRYGDGQKISFAVISGHGTEETVRLGKDVWWKNIFSKRDDSVIGSKDVDWIQSIRHVFNDSPWIIFNACSTGAENGVAQKISKAIGGFTMAPETPSAGMIQDAIPVFENGKLAGFEDKTQHLTAYRNGEKHR